ncbi:hypothetical protein [Rhodovulum sulfidophilum]|uniref:Uncharacterized protein n=1 Tax=Rhodovulum sulfidophilum TaxID=35806 RepID=A0ABS1RQ04_RHOSU|nr:hypothetical protein [Rhodovulum sulfidophilum]MBL3607978.1 hypothetical protein [Rhodovulum sulfidophilum]MCE8457276.1 hypothetical protein [Rhodovulum sulfidophilum]
MSGVYSEPSRNSASKGGLSHQTLDELEAVRSLISSELAVLRTTVDEMFAADLDRNLALVIPDGDLSGTEWSSVTRGTRDAMAARNLFGINTTLASLSASDPTSRTIVVDGGRLDMTPEDLVAGSIDALAYRRMTVIRTSCQRDATEGLSALT